MAFQDIWIALLSLLDVISGAVLASSFGFLLLPSAAGFLVGAVGSAVTGIVTPISFQQENIVLTRDLSKDHRERISMILGAALITGLLGIFGLPQLIVDTIGPEIFFGMLAGVGLYLTKVGYDLAREDWSVGLPCLLAALVVQFWTDNLVWAVTASVLLGVALNLVKQRFSGQQTALTIKAPEYASLQEGIRREFRLIAPVVNRVVVVGALALATLTLGGNIAYHAVNLDISETMGGYNEVSVVSGLADFASSLFGGTAMEVIVTVTAKAPNPVLSGVLLMVGAAIAIGSGIAYKVAKYIPLAGMGGYLVVIGAILVLPFNAMDAFAAGNPLVVALTMGTTLTTNPFYGMIAGLLTRLVMGWLGVL